MDLTEEKVSFDTMPKQANKYLPDMQMRTDISDGDPDFEEAFYILCPLSYQRTDLGPMSRNVDGFRPAQPRVCSMEICKFANDQQIIRPMFENETNKLREDIALWEELLETDVRQDLKFEEHLLLSLFAGTQVHIEALKSNIPYESLDEPEELADDTFEEAEVEDEVVEIDRLIDKAYELMGLAQAKYYPEGLPVPEPDITAKKTGDSVTPDKPVTKRKRHLDNASQLGVFIVVLFVVVVLASLLFGD